MKTKYREFWICENRIHSCDCILEQKEKPNIADVFGPFQVIEKEALDECEALFRECEDMLEATLTHHNHPNIDANWRYYTDETLKPIWNELLTKLKGRQNDSKSTS